METHVSLNQNKLLTDSPRVLDLTDEKGLLCGRILADLGADVIKIERPGGDCSRNIGPFYHDTPSPEKSLYWFIYNANKRGITLDIKNKDGQHIFKKLVGRADLVIESYSPGYMDELGLDYSVLDGINHKVIMTSITPFGQTGPYKNFKASDLTGIALSGWMYMCGDPDRPPVQVSFPQAYLNAGAEAAVGSMIAYYHRERTGEGQHVDVSMLESLVLNSSNAPSDFELSGNIMKRVGPFRTGLSSPVRTRWTWQCKDGFVAFTLIAGIIGVATNRNLVEWMDGEGMANELLKSTDWAIWDMAKTSQEEVEQFEAPIAEFFLTHTKAELYDGALKRRIMLMPVSTPKNIVENPQLDNRDFWTEVAHPELGDGIAYPGTPIRTNEFISRIERRAPLIGEHNREIYQEELGLTPEELSLLKQSGVI